MKTPVVLIDGATGDRALLSPLSWIGISILHVPVVHGDLRLIENKRKAIELLKGWRVALQIFLAHIDS